MKKPLAILSDNPKLNSLHIIIEEHKKSIRERMIFIKRQVEILEEESDKFCEPYWAEIEKEVKNKLPIDYKENWHLMFDENALYACKNKGELPEFLQELFGKK